MIKDYGAFCAARARFKEYAAHLEKEALALDYGGAISALLGASMLPPFSIYNESLDSITEDAVIKVILVGDNPGKKEKETGRYLVGASGKIAEGFFASRPELGLDFRKNVIILNKCLLHTPRTEQLKKLCKNEKIAALVKESQKESARLLKSFYDAMEGCAVWVVGYSELKKGGLFEEYGRALFALIPEDALFVFRHFSMNQFSADFNKTFRAAASAASAKDVLLEKGAGYRERVRGALAR